MTDGNEQSFESLAIAVASGQKICHAAKAIGLSESQAYRIARKGGFKTRVAEHRTEAIKGAVGRLSEAATAAVDTLTELLDKSNPPPTRCAAAKAILASVVPMSETLELRQRMDELERQHQLRVAG